MMMGVKKEGRLNDGIVLLVGDDERKTASEFQALIKLRNRSDEYNPKAASTVKIKSKPEKIRRLPLDIMKLAQVREDFKSANADKTM